ncbi:XRCC4-like factor-domain-containing protein [Chaetomium sp. MPI-SDFR-AT-0129]|nr:XRCC4-like factor-domain-containing protein [Chaetomium sp. MPI-SDFR-AT-0129]
MAGYAWRLLPATAPGLPTLLASACFNADSYTLHLTDLANVWTESMDRRPIIKRGMVEDTSIDPSDGPDQIRKMLELLRAAFDSSDPEHGNTSLTLAPGDGADALVIHVTCQLPKPLKPFKWPMHLARGSQSAVTSQLVLPLIQAHEARTREIDQLVGLLREKDAVINRLVDKLEATGTGLDHVFNALSGKRNVSRATAGDRVKGLGTFSESEFRNKAAELRPISETSDVSALLGSAFGAPGLRYKPGTDLEESTELNNWWAKLGKGRSVVLSERTPQEESNSAPLPPSEPEPSKEDDDDFQVQATPPGARSTRKRGSSLKPAPPVDDDETSDGEDANDTTPPSPPPAKPKTVSGSKLGAIGRNRRPSPSPPPPPPPQSDTQSETASEADDENLEDAPPPPSPKPALKRGGLGRIGGKPKPQETTKESTRSASPSAAPQHDGPPSQLPRRHKLGTIGSKKGAEASPSPGPSSTSDDTRGRSKTPAASAGQKAAAKAARETSQERADRKRAELQREMEKRAAAGPAKKKRKF